MSKHSTCSYHTYASTDTTYDWDYDSYSYTSIVEGKRYTDGHRAQYSSSDKYEGIYRSSEDDWD